MRFEKARLSFKNVLEEVGGLIDIKNDVKKKENVRRRTAVICWESCISPKRPVKNEEEKNKAGLNKTDTLKIGNWREESLLTVEEVFGKIIEAKKAKDELNKRQVFLKKLEG